MKFDSLLTQLFLFTAFWVLFSSCTDRKAEQVVSGHFEYVSPEHSSVYFTNKVEETVDRNIGKYDYFYNGGGVGIADLNNDDLPDLFFCGNDVPNKLYLNRGNFKFEDVSKSAGIETKKWSTGVTFVDINSDAWLDIYVCHSGPDHYTGDMNNELYINNQDGTFTESARVFGIDDNSQSTHAVFFDYDQDNDLDLLVLNHALRNLGNKSFEWLLSADKLAKEQKDRFTNTLYENKGNGQYMNRSKGSGMENMGFGLGIAVSDFSGSGKAEVYVANDYFLPDNYFSFDGKMFKDIARDRMSHCSFFSMGCDAADINNDGHIDLLVLDMTPEDHYRSKMLMPSMNVNEFNYLKQDMGFLPQYMFNTLQINKGYGQMADIGQLSGISKTDWSWAPLIADFDNDGLKDVFISNGYKRDLMNNDWRLSLFEKMKSPDFDEKDYFEYLKIADQTPLSNQFFKNLDGIQFTEKTSEWKNSKPSFSNGAAYGDLDGDGDLDIVVNNLDQTAFILDNQLNDQNFIRVQFKKGSSNLGTGARAEITDASGRKQVAEFQFSRGFQSTCEDVVHFGLGRETEIKSFKIYWPNNLYSEMISPEINQTIIIDPDDLPRLPMNKNNEAPLFIDLSDFIFPESHFHRENRFDDFEKEILLPHKLSNLGPPLAVADFDLNGYEDFIVGGALEQNASVFLQDSSGHFEKRRSEIFLLNRNTEDLGCLTLDVNQDGYMDVYMARGGGGEVEGNDKLLQDQLFINNGNGTFSITNSLPKITSSTKAIASLDWDSDGDLDLFVGGRNVPGKYPLAPRSYLLENEDGIFNDVTHSMSAELSNIGMVTDAKFFDWNDDGKKDLIVVGEWMPITVFIFNDGIFEKLESDLFEDTYGWWNCLDFADFDMDGDQDLVFGNLGLNNKFHVSKENTLFVFSDDFDDNGSLDIVLSKIYNGKRVPVRGKECSSSQMPFIAEAFPTFQDFAMADLDQIYGSEKINDALQLYVNTFESIYIENLGGGKYRKVPLPIESQISPINDMLIKDFTNDSKLDILLAGNRIETEVETIPYDAGNGLLLIGNGDGSFSASLDMAESGLGLKGDVNALSAIELSSDRYSGIVCAINNQKLRVLMLNERKRE